MTQAGDEEEDGGGEKGGSGERREENLPSDGCLAVKEVELAMALDGNGSIGSSKSKRKGRTATLSSTTNPQWANGGEREAREEEEEARGDAHGDHGREGEGEDKAEGKSGLAVAYFYAVGNVTLDVVAATITVAEHGALTTADVNLLRFGFAGVVLTAAVVARAVCGVSGSGSGAGLSSPDRALRAAVVTPADFHAMCRRTLKLKAAEFPDEAVATYDGALERERHAVAHVAQAQHRLGHALEKLPAEVIRPVRLFPAEQGCEQASKCILVLDAEPREELRGGNAERECRRGNNVLRLLRGLQLGP